MKLRRGRAVLPQSELVVSLEDKSYRLKATYRHEFMGHTARLTIGPVPATKSCSFWERSKTLPLLCLHSEMRGAWVFLSPCCGKELWPQEDHRREPAKFLLCPQCLTVLEGSEYDCREKTLTSQIQRLTEAMELPPLLAELLLQTLLGSAADVLTSAEAKAGVTSR